MQAVRGSAPAVIQSRPTDVAAWADEGIVVATVGFCLWCGLRPWPCSLKTALTLPFKGEPWQSCFTV